MAFAVHRTTQRQAAGSPSPPLLQSPPISGLRLIGNQIGNTREVLRPTDVDVAGASYTCSKGWGTFDGLTDAASVAVMATSYVGTARYPLTEDCWLGTNGVKPQYAGPV